MMAVPRFPISKHADDRLDYTFDWSTWLNGQTISSSAWTVPGELTGSGAASTSTSTSITVSGGSANRQYVIKNTITTSGGLQKVAFIDLSVQ